MGLRAVFGLDLLQKCFECIYCGRAILGLPGVIPQCLTDLSRSLGGDSKNSVLCVQALSSLLRAKCLVD